MMNGDDEDVDGVAPRELQRRAIGRLDHAGSWSLVLPLRSSIAPIASTFRKSTVSRTSCTRTIAAPRALRGGDGGERAERRDRVRSRGR